MVGKEIIMAIDPDIDKSGIAIYRKGYGLKVCKWAMPELVEYLRANKQNVYAIVECGYLNKIPNFHGGNFRVSQKIAANVGQNWQVAHTIVEFCKFYHVEYKEQKPLRKYWQGKDGKITEPELNALIARKLGYHVSGTNQDERDAILLLFHNIC